MKEPLRTFSDTVHWCQILIGVAGLLIGTLVYLVDRPPGQTYFIYNSSVDFSLYSILPNIFGFIGNSLPAFIHVFSFILITAGILSSGKRNYIFICSAWLLIDYAFELGQKYSAIALKLIPDWFAGIPFLENSQYYFTRGTFDFHDLLAITSGTIMAYFVLLTTGERGVKNEKRQ